MKSEVEKKFKLRLHPSTIRKQRKKLNFIAEKPRFIPHIREKNKEKRLDFCMQLQATNDQFDDVIFTDECSVQLGSNRRLVLTKVFRDDKGKIISKDIPHISKVKHPLKVHVWGGISKRGPTQILVFTGIMKADFYTECVLQNTLLPAIHNLYPSPNSHRLWQDNDPKHTSTKARNFMTQNEINWFKTPAESPDLNMIENVWSAMKYNVGKTNPKNQAELVSALTQFWNEHLTPQQCCRYINHIHRVIPKVIEKEGGYSGF